MTPGPGCLGWGLAAGAEARYSLHPRDGAGPLLAGRLRRGSILSISTHGLAAADFDLAPGGRYVLDWDWSWFETPLAYTAAQPPVLPASTVVIAGTPIILAAGPDVAVLAPEAVDIQTGNDRYEFSVSAPARHLVELRSAQGATALELCWTPGPEALLAAAASEAMSAPTTPAGVVALPDLDAALVVQQAARQAALQSVPVEDALDLFTARLVDDGTRAGPLAAVFLCGEFERTADSELLAAATRVVLEGTPAAGLGVAATRVCLARLVAGLSFRAVTERVRAVAATLDAPRLLEAAVDRQLSAAELLIVTASAASGIEQGSGPSGRPVPPSALFRLLRALGLQLGAGLPGSAVSPLPTDRLAHLTTIFGLLPEDLATSTRPHWGVSASELAERAVPMLLDRLQHEPLGAGHGWLAVLSNLQ